MLFDGWAAQVTALAAAPGQRSRSGATRSASAHRYVPATKVQPEDVAAINLLVPAGGTFSVTVEGLPVSFAIDPTRIGRASGASKAAEMAGFELIWSIG